MVKRWHETDDEAIRRAAAQRSGSAWPASVMLPHRGSVSAKQAAQRFSALGGVAAIVAGNAVGDDELDATLHDKVCDLEGRVDGIDQRVDQGAQLIRGLDERVYAIENLDTHGVGAPPAAETSDGYELLDADTSHELAEMATTHPNVRLLLEHNDRIEAQLREAQHALRDTQRALRGTKVGMRAMRHIYATAIQSHARTWLAERATGLTATRCRVIVLQTRARRRAAGSRLVRARRAAVTIAAAWRRFAVIAHMTIGKCLYGKRMLRLECEYLAECLDKAAKREKKLEIEASEAYKREKKLKIEASRNLLPPGSTVALYSRFARCFVQIKDDEATASGTGNRIKLKFDVDVRLRDPNLRQGSYCAERLFVVDAGDGAIALHSAAYNTSGFLSMRAGKVAQCRLQYERLLAHACG
ncbi:hypothetical protein M885DRAFT_495847 [Pelagophyceae sp. CCMP2097]|nr:hypothetical protein M885DRAFT_495847 [Pelagophyceae sp. CCMP2097]